ncbi:phosphate ABC transporter permease subunit PstC [Actinobacillus pleuropneumoniae]|uniref:Phosphate transport system permease protein n=1 Tax=Actinobacillus pleuropneumoniae TaxID=715 RepID=A0A9Q4H7C3_ACTPL|nr:phosphate ABC transporter permease subunit PstC [Actinobacillus pleuropneumoniae]MCL7720851.1 phosphate ABC transporter permease subunit PstC [Actinobacillus pleuropneumoniae]MCL7726672.1 phosphate ABC transporter permease subunit PstC [Actinobacillus pleuropneumoniae]MCL7729176.1 phosphate ABC transporter permease subunit PstC [Actinobacillus pleuropneumoniae]MCY6368182.1 phosphate ABC transporter permease subunit PstC [Actinobacillus pleuropneumoniae]MCY6385051.1 phosphate ABC transporter
MPNTQKPSCLNHPFVEGLFKHTTQFFAWLVFAMLAAILISLVIGSWDSLTRFGLSFLWTNDWDPINENFGALVPVIGTLISALIALLIAVLISFGIAVFLTELAPEWLKRPIGVAVEMLAAIPSIIYGMWGLFVFVQEYIQPTLIEVLGDLPLIGVLFSGAPFGIGLFTAGLVLAIMIIPYIASMMREVFGVVPPMLKESAYGLGSTTWEVVWKIVLPYTKAGVVGSMMLGLGRALGETMAVTFVIGNAFNLPESLFSPSASIASSIANEFNEATGLQKSALMELSLILFLITTAVLSISRLMILRMTQKEGKK